MTKLILFDIDGTLILTGGAGGRAMTRAFATVFGISEAFRGIPLPGRTDARILSDAFTRHRIELAADGPHLFREKYIEYLKEEIERPHPDKRVLPGVRALLESLAGHADLHLGLVTGNYAEAAQIKLSHFGLWHYFRAAAFGDDEVDRNALVPVAIARARDHGLATVAARDVIVVGDTPHDIACAQAAGATAIGVATGNFSEDELIRAGADIVVPDLRHRDATLVLVGSDLAEAPGSRTQPPRKAGSDRF